MSRLPAKLEGTDWTDNLVSPLSSIDQSGEDKLSSLLQRLTAAYRSSSALRKLFTARKVETMLPNIADFAAVSSSFSRPETAQKQREASAAWLSALLELGKLGHSLSGQASYLIDFPN